MFFEIEKKLKSVAKAMAAFGVLAAIAASRGSSNCAFNVISVTKIQ